MKILVCAYSCLQDPDKRFGDGGEGFLGWNIIRQIARFNKVWVLTHTGNKDAIEKKLETKSASNISFCYILLPAWLGFLNKIHGGIQLYAYLWQIRAYFVAKELNRENHFDVFHHVTYANDWMASFIGALLPIPYIRGPGGGAHRVPKNFLKEYSLKEKLLDKLRNTGQCIFKHDPFFIIGQNKTRAILVCNRESFNSLLKKWQRKTYFFPVNGVSRKDLSLLLPKETPKNKFSIITAGKLLKIKNFDLAIRAFKIFSYKATEVGLTIIGNGPELLRLKDLAEGLGISEKVKFEKWMPRKNLLRKIAISDIFLFPSLRDGGGAVVVEAMAMGRPVVCFNISGPGFHIDDKCGIKIKPENPGQAVKDMAEALEKLYIDKELRKKLGKGAREKAEREYDWDKLGGRLQKIYQEVLDEK